MPHTALIILDGFGINENNLEENAIHKAKTPTFDTLFSKLYTKLDAAGKAVGVPNGQMGNSEIGHLTIGAGKVFKQSLVKIDELFTDKQFEELSAFKKGLAQAKAYQSVIHLFTLFGDGGVHASGHHLTEILKIIPSDIKISLHLFADGKDVAPSSMGELLSNYQKNVLNQYPNVIISSISGRYFAMDRDHNWERVKKSYDVIFFRNNQTNLSPLDYIQSQYDQKITDEFFEPTFFEGGRTIENNDVIFYLNYRSDRAEAIAKVVTQTDFEGFERKKLHNLYFVSMTKYYQDYLGDIFVADEKLDTVLAKVISEHNLTQFHLAETEKFSHVTKYLNGGTQTTFPGEKDVVIPSSKVATHDLYPLMRAQEIYEEFEKNSTNYDFTVVNFANGDMIGHTGKMEACIQTVEKLDEIVAKLIDFCDTSDINLLITADHGNCEEMGSTTAPKTSHTINQVPFWYIVHKEVIPTKPTGGLSNIAATILEIMGIEKPKEMDESLI